MDDQLLAVLVARYEEIRGNVMGYTAGSAAGRLGLAVIRHYGMALWLRTWMKEVCSSSVASPKPTAVPGRLLAENVTAQIVSIMATMALNRKQESYA
jgi:hypothetical protein